MPLDSILFDLDGTLWDSVAGVTASWQRVIKRYPGLRGPVTDAELSACMGFTTDEIAQMIFPDASSAVRKQIIAECFREEHAYLRQFGGQIYSGAEQTLAYLSQHYQLAIVSNCEAGYIECFLEISGFGQYFEDFESFGATGKHKGENIALVLERMHSTGALYVGDIIKDQQAAQYASVPFVFASYGFGQGALRPTHWDYVINSLPELIPLIEQEASR